MLAGMAGPCSQLAGSAQPHTDLSGGLASGMQELRKGRVQRLWEWGRCIYRCIAFSYGTFSVYQNPWLVRALLAAIWTAAKVILGALV